MSARAEMMQRIAEALDGLDLSGLQGVLAEAGWHNGHKDPDDLTSSVVLLSAEQVAERITDGLSMPIHRQLQANAAVTLAGVAPIQDSRRKHNDTCWRRHADCLASRVREQLGLGIG